MSTPVLMLWLVATGAELPMVRLDVPCLAAAAVAAVLRDVGLELTYKDALADDAGELEIWRSADGKAWQAVIHVAAEELRCPVAGNGIGLVLPPI